MEMEARGNGSSTSEALLQDRLLRLDALLRVRRFYRTFERSESLIRAREIAISTSPDCSQWRLGYDAEDTDWPLISKLVGASRALRRDSVVLRTEYKGLTRSGAMEYLFLPVGGKRLVKPETLTVDEADEILKAAVEAQSARCAAPLEELVQRFGSEDGARRAVVDAARRGARIDDAKLPPLGLEGLAALRSARLRASPFRRSSIRLAKRSVSSLWLRLNGLSLVPSSSRDDTDEPGLAPGAEEVTALNVLESLPGALRRDDELGADMVQNVEADVAAIERELKKVVRERDALLRGDISSSKGAGDRVQAARDIRSKDAAVLSLRRLLSVRSMQLELEKVYAFLEAEANELSFDPGLRGDKGSEYFMKVLRTCSALVTDAEDEEADDADVSGSGDADISGSDDNSGGIVGTTTTTASTSTEDGVNAAVSSDAGGSDTAGMSSGTSGGTSSSKRRRGFDDDVLVYVTAFGDISFKLLPNVVKTDEALGSGIDAALHADALAETLMLDVDDVELAQLSADVADLKSSLGIDLVGIGLPGGIGGPTLDMQAGMRRAEKYVTGVQTKFADGFIFSSRTVRLLVSDVRSSARLFWKALNGTTLRLREVRQLRRTARDLLVFIPFAIILLAPLTPVGHVAVFAFIQKYFPDIFPSQLSIRRQELMLRYDEIERQLRRSEARRLQEEEEREEEEELATTGIALKQLATSTSSSTSQEQLSPTEAVASTRGTHTHGDGESTSQ